MKRINKLTTAAFLAGVTTLSVTLPMMPAAASVAKDGVKMEQTQKVDKS